MVEVGEVSELVHDADQAAVGRGSQSVFEGLRPFNLDQVGWSSVRGQQVSERVDKSGQQGLVRFSGAPDPRRVSARTAEE